MIATKQRGERAKRWYPRYVLASEIRAVKISPESRLRKGHPAVVRGVIQNISDGGLCCQTKQRGEAFSLVRCQVFLPDIPVAIPTLAQVKWAREKSRKGGYFVGLQFLL